MSISLSVELFNQIISSLKSDGTCSHGQENRKQARVGLRCYLDIVPCTFTADKLKPVKMHVHDLSTNGIGMLSPIRLTEGSEFIANFSREGHPAVPVLYTVKWSRRISGDLYAVGALFKRSLPDAAGETVPIGMLKQNNRRSKRAAAARTEPNEVDAEWVMI